ncbi:MAG: nitrate reductase cytochrome c-type subunit [Acidobacteriota bacterium]
MRTPLGFVGVLLILTACSPSTDSGVPVPDRPGVVKTAALERAERRLFDGAPPVIPHTNQGMACITCHNRQGMAVDGLGFAPPSPHEETAGMSALSYCQQCHVFQEPAEPFARNSFAGLRQDLRQGRQLHEFAPPVIPHKVFMRENCQACHSGPAAREEIRTDHPERTPCQQCHVEQKTTEVFL